jgi:hypothetical protein
MVERCDAAASSGMSGRRPRKEAVPLRRRPMAVVGAWGALPSAARVCELVGSPTSVVPGCWSGGSRRWRRLAIVGFFGCKGGNEAGRR